MKHLRLVMMIGLVVGYQTNALSDSAERDLICRSSSDLNLYLSDVLTSNPSLGSHTLSSGEMAQIQGILDAAALVNSPAREKFEAVISACSEGQILAERFNFN